MNIRVSQGSQIVTETAEPCMEKLNIIRFLIIKQVVSVCGAK